MKTYLDKTTCKEFEKKIITIVIFKLIEIDKIKSDSKKTNKYEKIKEELVCLNNLLMEFKNYTKS